MTLPPEMERNTERMPTLDTLSRGDAAVIASVVYRTPKDPIAARLSALGFVAGESVRVVATGPFGKDPIAVCLGTARFALRRSEAARVSLLDRA